MNLTILQGDCREKLRELPDASVHCVVTSPPYWGLRDYNTPPRIWGGRPECDHEWGQAVRTPWANDLPGPNGRKKNVAVTRQRPKETGPFCQKCEAWLGSLGLEPTPELFVRNLVLVFREVWRVIRDDGTLWVNMGDSHYGSWQNYGGGNRGAGKQRPIIRGSSAQNPVWEGLEAYRPASTRKHSTLKPKDLVGMPWRLAFALQADGWWLRQDIIWSKPNGMVESVEDRPTMIHEYIFLLSKRKRYFYDHAAVKEPAVSDHASGNGFKRNERLSYQNSDGSPRGNDKQWTDVGGLRNRRSVWTIAPAQYPGAHFATYPPALIKPCILAGCPVGGVVLDPFGGSGTTGKVALELGRSAILIELNPDYVKLIEKRCRVNLPLMFEEVTQ